MWFDNLTIAGLLAMVTYVIVVYALMREMREEAESNAMRRRGPRFRLRDRQECN
jgi:hypothetical protein